MVSWHVIGYGAAVLTLAGLTMAYEGAQRDKIRMQATQSAQEQYQKQLTSQMADLQKQMSDREAKYQQDKQDLQKQFQGSLQQIAAMIGQRANLPVPLQIVTPQPTATNPNPQPQVIVPSGDLPQAKAYLQECEQCKLDKAKVQADLADREAQAVLAQKQIDSLKTERDVAVKAAKGGSWLRRVAKAAEYLVIGGAVGYAAAKH